MNGASLEASRNREKREREDEVRRVNYLIVCSVFGG